MAPWNKQLRGLWLGFDFLPAEIFWAIAPFGSDGPAAGTSQAHTKERNEDVKNFERKQHINDPLTACPRFPYSLVFLSTSSIFS